MAVFRCEHHYADHSTPASTRIPRGPGLTLHGGEGRGLWAYSGLGSGAYL